MASEATGTVEQPRKPTDGVVTALAELPRDAHLDAKALGAILGRCKKTVQLAVRRGELPPPVKFLGRHTWLVGTILDHFRTRQEAVVKVADKRTLRLAEHRP